MSVRVSLISLTVGFLALSVPMLAAASSSVPVLPIDPGAAMDTSGHGSVNTGSGVYDLEIEEGNSLNLLVPDVEGNYVLIPGGQRPSPSPGMEQAHEIKLKVRELAAQLLEVWPGQALTGVVAMPTTFVSLNNFGVGSGLGRYMAEALYYEFNLRGVATREYRVNGSIRLEPGQGEMALSRALRDPKVASRTMALIVGTYYRDKDAVFVNARLIRSSDGLVMRTAQIILPMTDMVARMSATPPFGSTFGCNGGLPIVQGNRK